MKKKIKTTEDVKTFVEKWSSAAKLEIMAWTDDQTFLHCHFKINVCLGTYFLHEISHGLNRICLVCTDLESLILLIPKKGL